MIAKPYSANRYDCVGFVLEQLEIKIKRINLPMGWWHNKNSLLECLASEIKEGNIKVKIKKIILSQSALLPGDIVFLRLRGKYTHHIGIMRKDSHYEHNLPGRGLTQDYLRPNTSFFRFGVRLWE